MKIEASQINLAVTSSGKSNLSLRENEKQKLGIPFRFASLEMVGRVDGCVAGQPSNH